MAEPVLRRNPREIRRDALRLATGYYDLSREELDAELRAQDQVLAEKLHEAEDTLPRAQARLRKAELADERLLLEKIRDAYLDFHRPDDAGEDQQMVQPPAPEQTEEP
jgi:hypothetical protein